MCFFVDVISFVRSFVFSFFSAFFNFRTETRFNAWFIDCGAYARRSEKKEIIRRTISSTNEVIRMPKWIYHWLNTILSQTISHVRFFFLFFEEKDFISILIAYQISYVSFAGKFNHQYVQFVTIQHYALIAHAHGVRFHLYTSGTFTSYNSNTFAIHQNRVLLVHLWDFVWKQSKNGHVLAFTIIIFKSFMSKIKLTKIFWNRKRRMSAFRITIQIQCLQRWFRFYSSTRARNVLAKSKIYKKNRPIAILDGEVQILR